MKNKIINYLKKNKLTQNVLIALRTFYFPAYLHVTKDFDFHVLDALESVKKIKHDKVSVSRFGDGEFNILYKAKGIGFQPYSSSLRNDLGKVFKNKDNDNLCIGVPQGFESTRVDRYRVKTFWWSYVVRERNYIKKFSYATNNNLYLDTNFTRVITELSDKAQIKIVIDEIKEIWADKEVLVIEGAGTKFGVGNDLFSGAKKISRIVAPSKDAYSKIDEIRVTVKDFLEDKDSKEMVVLMALGPTATVLAAEFSKYVQAIDIGHFDLQYEYLMKGYYKKVDIKNKYDNELFNGDVFIENQDEQYNKQIIKEIN
mgnify:CR=1 FL=1